MNRSTSKPGPRIEQDRSTCAFSPLLRMLLLAVLAAGSSCHALSVCAGPRIDIGFEADAADSQKLVHAQAVFDAPQAIIIDVFNRIAAYPTLHDWIRDTSLVHKSSDSQEYLVQFSFPWPVGRQWSRVEVHHSGNTIYWRQTEGSLKTNHGRISFATAGDEVHIDYCAAIDVGLPELWTRAYKKKFITEFLTAAYDQSRRSGSAAPLALAAEP
jgi:uncharacterized membrane protein